MRGLGGGWWWGGEELHAGHTPVARHLPKSQGNADAGPQAKLCLDHPGSGED